MQQRSCRQDAGFALAGQIQSLPLLRLMGEVNVKDSSPPTPASSSDSAACHSAVRATSLRVLAIQLKLCLI